MSSTNEGSIVQIEMGNDDELLNDKSNKNEKKITAADTMSSSDNGDEDLTLYTNDAATDTDIADEQKVDLKVKEHSWLSSILAFYFAYDFPIHILIAISLAKAYPPLGAEKLNPMITAGWVATGIIFFLSGLGLDTGDLLKVVFRHVGFNVFVEVFNFGVVSSIVFGVSRALATTGVLPQALADGLLMASCLPMSINAVIILTTAAHGDVAAAIFHTTVGNITGIFLSPILIVLYLPKVSTDVDLPHVFKDLTYKVIIPLICGQIVHILVKPARDFYKVHKKIFKKIQETSLVYIVYTVFCRKFIKGEVDDMGFGPVAIVIVFIFLCMTTCMTLAWFTMKPLFNKDPALRVMGVFGCTQKTIALGIPLILSIFKGSPNESLYTLPILIWHPMQLVVGSFLVPKLQKFIASENERLGIVEDKAVQVSDATTAVPTATPNVTIPSAVALEESEEYV